MLNLRKLTIDYFVEQLKSAYRRTYGDMEPSYGNIIAWSGRLALENIANSDALYHNVEHTILVTVKEWINNLYSLVFAAEHDQHGP